MTEDIILAGMTAREYTIRLFEAESLLEKLGYVRGADHRWRKKETGEDIREREKLTELGKQSKREWVTR